MKIVHLVSTFPPYKGGMGNAAAQIAELQSAHQDVTVFTPIYGESAPSKEFSFSVDWVQSPFKIGNAAGLPQLIWRLRSFDMIYLHYPFYGTHLPVLLACILWRRKLVLHYHMDSIAPGLKGAIFKFNRKFVFPFLLRRANAVIGASLDYLANSHLAAYFRARPKKFREIPFWVDSEKFHPEEEEVERDVAVLFVGGLDQAHYFKGLEILLRAMKTAGAKGKKPIILRVVGSGDLLTYYQRLASELGIADKVQFLGKLDDMALVRAFQEASFLVLPSINQGEAFGLVLLEAMSSGKPVIASNLPGVRSVFNDGQEGFVVCVGDIDDLSEKILMLAENAALRDRMGKRAREWVLKKYRQESADEALEALCRQLVTEK